MKKLIVIALAVVMALSVVAFVACDNGQTVTGEYSYANPWTEGQSYGAKVSVTVKNGVITAVSVEADTETFFNLSAGWENKSLWEEKGQAMVDSFVGLTVDEVNAIVVECAESGQPNSIASAPAALKVVAGATQSSGRLILAVQNALSQLAK